MQLRSSLRFGLLIVPSFLYVLVLVLRQSENVRNACAKKAQRTALDFSGFFAPGFTSSSLRKESPQRRVDCLFACLLAASLLACLLG